ncbi:MAG: hypothetical protein HYZ10_08705 [Ignavibacteriales bacterium]|nr:hypothetical protein [Ignavibacteriales bacterium]
MDNKVVIVLGAGATFAEAPQNSVINSPPLDKHFFSICKNKYPKDTNSIQDYFLKNYHRNIYNPQYDSLESVMATIYTDVFDPRLKVEASKIFIDLINLFNKRLSISTNRIEANHQRYLYRILVRLFDTNYDPKDISFITFNQDINIEKVLDFVHSRKKWKSLEPFSFPRCYDLDMAGLATTGPTDSKECFDEPDDLPAKIKILKLHGSLNWYSTHKTNDFNPELFFDPERKLQITKRKKIVHNMTYKNPSSPYTLPVIIPPVNNKSAIMHNQLKLVWQKAEQKLRRATEIIFWGYSLPDLDFESRNLFVRNISDNKNIRTIVVIDPNSSVVKKYIDLLGLSDVMYYKDANVFIEKYFT